MLLGKGLGLWVYVDKLSAIKFPGPRWSYTQHLNNSTVALIACGYSHWIKFADFLRPISHHLCHDRRRLHGHNYPEQWLQKSLRRARQQWHIHTRLADLCMTMTAMTWQTDYPQQSEYGILQHMKPDKRYCDVKLQGVRPQNVMSLMSLITPLATHYYSNILPAQPTDHWGRL